TPRAFSWSSSKSLQEIQSPSRRAQPLSPMAPRAWSRGMQPSTSQSGPWRTQQPSGTDVLYCPEVTLALVGVLQRLSACQRDRVPDVYVACTMRNPETYQLFTTELGRAAIRWEAVPPHSQKLFPYEEHSEMAVLRLML
uniref:Uncharacterized protein n=1 Tax=Spermophilus dauricus TaxID=99837 RepID=A0A8C9P828_SPEDA